MNVICGVLFSQDVTLNAVNDHQADISLVTARAGWSGLVSISAVHISGGAAVIAFGDEVQTIPVDVSSSYEGVINVRALDTMHISSGAVDAVIRVLIEIL